MSRLRAPASIDPLTAGPAQALIEITERFITGFDDLRAVRSSLSSIYDTDVLRPARDMAGLYAIIDSTISGTPSLILPSLSKSRGSFNAMLLAANAYYLSLSADAGDEAKRNAEVIERTAPVMIDLASTDLQRNALTALRDRALSIRRGLGLLTEHFTTQERLLREAIDGNAAAMGAMTSQLTTTIQEREQRRQETFDSALRAVNAKVAIVALLFLFLVIGIGLAVSRSISAPGRAAAGDGCGSCAAITTAASPIWRPATRSARWRAPSRCSAPTPSPSARPKRRCASKDHAESALSELRDTQTEPDRGREARGARQPRRRRRARGQQSGRDQPHGRLEPGAPLRRVRARARERRVRRSRLAEFVAGNRDAAKQLVTNLHRAGELIQAFKQVAVDRSHADRRAFELENRSIRSSRPAAGPEEVADRLVVDVPDGIVMDSYPGPLGQVITNLFLNAVDHAFPDGTNGTISIVARTSGADQVHIVFSRLRRRHVGRGAAPGLRPVLHDPAQRRRHRARPAHRLQSRHPAALAAASALLDGRRRHHIPDQPAAGGAARRAPVRRRWR